MSPTKRRQVNHTRDFRVTRQKNQWSRNREVPSWQSGVGRVGDTKRGRRVAPSQVSEAEPCGSWFVALGHPSTLPPPPPHSVKELQIIFRPQPHSSLTPPSILRPFNSSGCWIRRRALGACERPCKLATALNRPTSTVRSSSANCSLNLTPTNFVIPRSWPCGRRGRRACQPGSSVSCMCPAAAPALPVKYREMTIS